MDSVTWLQDWYQLQCNGVWEHSFGVKIETLDNPGWRVEIDLLDTRFAALSNAKVREQSEGENDWFSCEIVNGVFKGVGGSNSLGVIVQAFRSWIDNF